MQEFVILRKVDQKVSKKVLAASKMQRGPKSFQITEKEIRVLSINREKYQELPGRIERVPRASKRQRKLSKACKWHRKRSKSLQGADKGFKSFQTG